MIFTLVEIGSHGGFWQRIALPSEKGVGMWGKRLGWGREVGEGQKQRGLLVRRGVQ